MREHTRIKTASVCSFYKYIHRFRPSTKGEQEASKSEVLKVSVTSKGRVSVIVEREETLEQRFTASSRLIKMQCPAINSTISIPVLRSRLPTVLETALSWSSEARIVNQTNIPLHYPVSQ